MNKRNAKWYRMTPESIIQQLHTDAACGISPKAARSRLKKNGANTLFDDRGKRRSSLKKMLIPDSQALLLLGGVLLSLLFLPLGVSVLFGVLFLLSVSFFYVSLRRIRKNETEIAKYRIPDACVIRGGVPLSVSARTVVAGDILILKAGDIVPCDCRLLSQHDLRVLTLMPDEKGHPIFCELPKNADTKYSYGDAYTPPYCENVLFGGSEILAGGARAVAVETGGFCFLGAMEHFHMPAEQRNGQSGEDSLRELRSYLRVYGFLMLALLIPLSVIGVLVAPSTLGIPDIFFPLCLICGMASPVLLMLYFRLIAMRAAVSCMDPTLKQSCVVFKADRAADKLGMSSDLFLLGHKALSDGTLHLHSAILGTLQTYPSADADTDALRHLCEAFAILKKASAEKLKIADADLAESENSYLKELISLCKYDMDALDIRFVHASHYRGAERDVELVDVQMKSGTFTLLFSSNAALLDRCTLYEDKGRLGELSPARKRELCIFFESAVKDACHVTLVARRSANSLFSLVGILATRERIQDGLDASANGFLECGVRPSFFLYGDAVYEDAFANACKLPGRRIVCSDTAPTLTEDLLDEYRVFIGFPHEQLAPLMAKLQRKRRCVGILTGNCEDRALLKEASFTVATDPTTIHKGAKEDAVRRDPLGGGKEGSTRAAQTVRRRADVLVSRAEKTQGGLSALLGAFYECRAIGYRSFLLFSYLVPTQMLRVFAAICFTVLGLGLPGALQILYVGLCLDTLALSLILSMNIPRVLLKKPRRIGERHIEQLVLEKRAWIPTLVSVGVFALYLAILTWIGVIDVYCVHTLTFVSLLLLEVLMLYKAIYPEGISYPTSLWRHPAVMLLLPIVLLIPFSVIFPLVGSVTGLGSWSPLTVLSVPLLPILYLLSKYFFDRTAK
ncbi:MAG: hypothetical protein E7643_07370 [Ruminococcaceae bacterium]|nr:hypothetical protein [Oscillospiraceae bacterium]